MSKPFADVIRDYRNGALHDKLTGELAQAVQRAVTTGSAAELTIKLKIKPDKGQLKVTATSKLVLPAEIEVGDALFFPDDDGGLHRTDPRQGELPMMRDATKKSSTVQ